MIPVKSRDARCAAVRIGQPNGWVRATTAKQGETFMTLGRTVTAFAGAIVLLSVALTVWVSPWFLWLTVFIGLNLFQSAFTGFCPAAIVFRRLGVKPGPAF
jgi:hypothetical protein